MLLRWQGDANIGIETAAECGDKLMMVKFTSILGENMHVQALFRGACRRGEVDHVAEILQQYGSRSPGRMVEDDSLRLRCQPLAGVVVAAATGRESLVRWLIDHINRSKAERETRGLVERKDIHRAALVTALVTALVAACRGFVKARREGVSELSPVADEFGDAVLDSGTVCVLSSSLEGYFRNLTLKEGARLYSNGFKIFVSETLDYRLGWITGTDPKEDMANLRVRPCGDRRDYARIIMRCLQIVGIAALSRPLRRHLRWPQHAELLLMLAEMGVSHDQIEQLAHSVPVAAKFAQHIQDIRDRVSDRNLALLTFAYALPTFERAYMLVSF
jgi:hypothetical protein